MNRFEYKCVAIIGGGRATTAVMNEYGREGWELVGTWAFWYYFKRCLPTER